jgi:hypothetical protein
LFRRRRAQAVGIVVSEAEEPADGCWYVTAELAVDGRQLAAFDHGPLDLHQLWASCVRPGWYFIWTCDCGDPGCAGRFRGVRVSHRGGLADWRDADSGERYCFRRAELSAALAGAWRRGRELLAADRRVPCPEANRSFFAQHEPRPAEPVAFLPEWRTDTTVSLARTMYESRDFGAMPILADALQDVGCDSAEVLNHCRGPGPHVRGCWVVDLVLGKT